MAIRVTNLREANSIQASQRSKRTLGTKVLELGKEYILLFHKKDNELAVSSIIGYSCDRDALGISFVRISDSQMEVNEETNRIKDISGMQQWATLSNILYRAAKIRDIENKKEEAQKIADREGTSIDETALQQAIAKVELAYDGQARHGDEPAILPTKKRLISSKLEFSIFTEAVLIPLDKTLQPEYDKAVGVQVILSKTRQRQLSDILDNNMYNNLNDPDGFLEVKFSYKGADSREAGRNSYNGAEETVRKINLEQVNGVYVDKNVENIKHILNDTSNDYQTIFNRASAVTYARTVQDAEAAMRKYLAGDRTLPLYINLEDDSVKRAAKELLELGVFKPNTKQYKELEDMVNGIEEDNPIEELNAGVKDLMNATNTKEVDKVLKDNEELADMLNSDEIEDI